MRTLISVLTLVLSFNAYAETASPAFKYNSDTGTCTNAEGAAGYNNVSSIHVSEPTSVEMTYSESGRLVSTVIDNMDAECVDFSGVEEFFLLLPHGTPYGMVLIRTLNAKGSYMRDLPILNLTIDRALLEGADFRELDCVYSNIGISADRHSTPRPELYTKKHLEMKRGKWKDSYIDSLTHFCTTSSIFHP